eukprot:294905_1
MTNKPTVVKILILGDYTTNKTKIIKKYVHKRPNQTAETTIGVDIASKVVRVGAQKLLKLQLWQIVGQQPSYYRHSCAALIVFDFTNPSTLNNAKRWKKDLDENVFLENGDNVPVILVADTDLIEKNPKLRQFTDNKLDEFCNKNNFGLAKPFIFIIIGF